MAWIESHQSLGDHPKTLRAAQILRIDPAQMVGHLHFLWWWALDYAPDGDISALTPREIAHAARWNRDGNQKSRDPEKFVEALVTCGRHGFLDRDGDTLQIHDWDLYAGKLLERRRRDAARKRGHPADIQRTSGGHPDQAAADGVRTARVLPNQPNQPNLPNQTQPTYQGTATAVPMREAQAPAVAPPAPLRPSKAKNAQDGQDGPGDSPDELPHTDGQKRAATATSRSEKGGLAMDTDPSFRKACQALDAIGVKLNLLAYDEIAMLLDEGTKPEWFAEAAVIAARNGASSWSYIRKVLLAWGPSGPPAPKSLEDRRLAEKRARDVDYIPVDQDPLYVGNWAKKKASQ